MKFGRTAAFHRDAARLPPEHYAMFKEACQLAVGVAANDGGSLDHPQRVALARASKTRRPVRRTPERSADRSDASEQVEEILAEGYRRE